MSNKQSSSIEWIIKQLIFKTEFENLPNQYVLMSDKDIDGIIEQAKEMEVAGREMSYSDGYREGYKRALDYMTMSIKNAIETKDK